MLDMPQMIQTWKEVRFSYLSEDVDEMLIPDCRGVMVVDGRNGRNKLRGRYRLGQEQLFVRDCRVYEHRVGNECIGRGVLQTIAGWCSWCKCISSLLHTKGHIQTQIRKVLSRVVFACD
jgi:hypothetical protein